MEIPFTESCEMGLTDESNDNNTSHSISVYENENSYDDLTVSLFWAQIYIPALPIDCKPKSCPVDID